MDLVYYSYYDNIVALEENIKIGFYWRHFKIVMKA